MSEQDGLSVVGSLRNVPDANKDTVVLKPLAISDFASIREEALDWFRRDYLKTYAKNADLLPNSDELIKEKFEEMARKRYEQLPDMEVIEYEDDVNSWKVRKEDRKIKETHQMEYMMWWMSTNPKGMMFALWLSAKRDQSQQSITQSQLEQRFMDDDGVLDEQILERAAQRLGALSSGGIAGNGEAPVDGGKKQRRAARKKRAEEREKRGK